MQTTQHAASTGRYGRCWVGVFLRTITDGRAQHVLSSSIRYIFGGSEGLSSAPRVVQYNTV